MISLRSSFSSSSLLLLFQRSSPFRSSSTRFFHSFSSSSYPSTLSSPSPSPSSSSNNNNNNNSNSNNNTINTTTTTTTNHNNTTTTNGTGIIMLNMGGPIDQSSVGGFLGRLFTDSEIVQLGGGWKQKLIGSLLAWRRTPDIKKQYNKIGGGSPILKWTDIQGKLMCELLDKISPSTAPHYHFIAFRYTEPLTETTIKLIQNNYTNNNNNNSDNNNNTNTNNNPNINRLVVFSQYPQYSCTTTGSSLSELWRTIKKQNLSSDIKFSLIDRWPTHPLFIDALIERIEYSLSQLPLSSINSSKINLLFSAHSLPTSVVNKGDPYIQEVHATVNAVMNKLKEKYLGSSNNSNNNNNNNNNNNSTNNPLFSHIQSILSSSRFLITWQSQVGRIPWQGPKTIDSVINLGKQGMEGLIVIPIAFVTDHLETLYELDIEIAEAAKNAGIKYYIRSPAMNDSPLFINALAGIVKDHLELSIKKKQDGGRITSIEYPYTCINCNNPLCRIIINPIQLHNDYKPNRDR